MSSKKKPVAQIELEGDEQRILDLIPLGEFISDEEILMNIDDISPEEISQIILQLELKNCIIEESGRYTRV